MGFGAKFWARFPVTLPPLKSGSQNKSFLYVLITADISDSHRKLINTDHKSIATGQAYFWLTCSGDHRTGVCPNARWTRMRCNGRACVTYNVHISVSLCSLYNTSYYLGSATDHY